MPELPEVEVPRRGLAPAIVGRSVTAVNVRTPKLREPLQDLAALLPGTEVSTTDEAGISGDDMEALAFAWLAWRTLAGLPGNLPSVTGASEASVLGAIFPANPPQNRS